MSFPFETERLVLRQFKKTDLEPFLVYRNDPQVYRYQGWKVPYERSLAEEFVEFQRLADPTREGEWFQTALELKATHTLIGDVGYFPRKGYNGQAYLGYTLARPFWGQGYAREAVSRIIEYLMDELKLHRIVADCDTDNTSSIRLLEWLGFRREAHHVESYWLGDRWGDEYDYALLEREWKARSLERQP